MTPRRAVLAWIGFALVLAGVAWLGPLMADQMTFFGDREQVADAAAARALMPWPALLVAAGAAMLATWHRSLHAVGAALPLVAVALALVMPDTLLQLIAYFITAPIAVGSALAAALPLGAATRRPAIVAVIVVVAGVAILAAAAPVPGGLLVLASLAWWGLSSRSGHRKRPSAVD